MIENGTFWEIVIRGRCYQSSDLSTILMIVNNIMNLIQYWNFPIQFTISETGKCEIERIDSMSCLDNKQMHNKKFSFEMADDTIFDMHIHFLGNFLRKYFKMPFKMYTNFAVFGYIATGFSISTFDARIYFHINKDIAIAYANWPDNFQQTIRLKKCFAINLPAPRKLSISI